jgi:low affinity Fe/Cu permease
MELNNDSSGNAAKTRLNFLNNTSFGANIILNSSNYTDGSTLDLIPNMFSITSTVNDINISPSSSGKTLLGYDTNTKAFEISSSGAMSFDTSNNSGSWVSNYGISGQILSSQGSGAPPKWSTISFAGFPKIIYIDSSQYFPAIQDTSGTLFSYNDASGLSINKTRIITFTTSFYVQNIGLNNILTFQLYINNSLTQSFNLYRPNNNEPLQYIILFKYSNTNTSETVVIKFNSNDNTLRFDASSIKIFKMEEIQ